MDEEIKKLLGVYHQSRLLLVCQSCFKLKPPVIVEIKSSLPCSWCSKKHSEENELFLLESPLHKGSENVEYLAIRKCRLLTEPKEICKNISELKWKTCPNGKDCKNPHSVIELKVWALEIGFCLTRSELAKRFRNSLTKDRKPLKGVFHCVVCSMNLATGKDFSEHCDSNSHKKLMRTTPEIKWTHRPLPPDTEKFVMCQSASSCEIGDDCPRAHSPEELKEWKNRFQLQKDKLKYASAAGLMSFIDTIKHEYDTCSSLATVLKDSLPGVKVRIKGRLSQNQKITLKKGSFVWRLKIHCNDNTEKLNHAAIYTMAGPRGAFRICRSRKGKHSKPVSHLNFKVLLDDNYSLNLYGGEGSYEVRFTAYNYGSYSSNLLLEFRNSPRPVLCFKFHVEVLDVRSQIDLLALSDHNRPINFKIQSWERERKIIRWNETATDVYSEAVANLSKKYKAPAAALEYDVSKRDRSAVPFHPDQLKLSNYVQEMHNFLYREEEARIKLLDRPRRFDIVLTNSYMSSRKGMSVATDNELFAIFELPVNLSRDTDEGLLILESCPKVLIGRSKHPSSQPVYEALIEEKFIDHIVILLSDSCVQAWDLSTGQVLEVEIQFQLNRERFCSCHYALDQLKANKQLPLVCPTYETNSTAVGVLNLKENTLDLDEDQKKVFSFLESEPVRSSGETVPLFVVQGSFGTGKTYTICKCIKFLLEHDKNAKILICTHSNSAADLYILNNFNDVKKWQNKVLRIVYHGRRRTAIPQLVQKYCLSNGSQFCYPSAQHIASHQVFITTFETALSLGNLGTSLGGCFTHIFLDEVAQVMEPSAIIPLTLADSGKTKVVIAGDHKQMTEKIYSRGNALNLNDSDFTLLSRMYKKYSPTHQRFQLDQHYLTNHLVVLRNNYRCVAPILQLIQLLFYTEGLLRPLATIKPLTEFKPIQFHDVEGCCELNRLTGGYYNEAEASYIRDMISDLLRGYPDDLEQSDIVVVSSYSDQVKLIRAKLRAVKCGDVKVEPVRNVQGLEYKIVVLSCVHKREAKQNTEGEKYGLLSDRNMLNTAFTRTKLAIIAVGHAVTLWSLGKCEIMWRKYIQICCQFKGMCPPQKDVESIELEASMRDFSALNPLAQEFVPGASKKASAPANKTQALEASEHDSSIVEEDVAFDDYVEGQEETLPLRDDILDDIVKNIVGFNPDKLVIKVDPSGVEFATEHTDQDDSNRSFDEDSETVHCDFSLDHLNFLMTTYPTDYKHCRLFIKTFYSATAILQEPEPELDSIQINTKRNLGRSFNQDEVVVHIEKRVREEQENSEDRLVAYGKVVGILSRYKDPAERKFICVPDRYNPGLMCPIDKRITKFIIHGRRDMSKVDLKVPICQLKKNKNGKEELQVIRKAEYSRFSMTLEKSKHFVVRFIKWPPRSYYPVGYVSEEIKPKNFELYYSLIHDVPSMTHKKSVDNEAATLSSQKLEGPRLNLKNSFVFTIDPEGSTDLDDALSLDKCADHDNCWKIGIHIADVASVIPADSDVDLEARKRANSFYSGNVSNDQERKVIHMLPTSLSSKKCSLRADGQKRPAISIFIHSTKLPVLTTSNKENKALNLPTPQLTYVTSKRQMTYREAEDLLRQARESGVQDITVSTEGNLSDQLYIIWQSMLKLRFQRQSWASFHGRPDFNEFEQFCYEASAHMLIEEAMITCNSCCSHFLQKKGCDFLLRTQNPPLSDESLKWKEENKESIRLSLFQQECMKQLQGEDEIRKMENIPQKPTNVPIFPHVWMKIQAALERNDLETALILFSSDTMQPALSSGHSGYLGIQVKAQLQSRLEVRKSTTPGCVTHFSLRLPLYSWFSSPIRRYTDLHSQRLILEKLASARKSALKDANVIEISQPIPPELKELGKKLMQRSDDAKKYEKDVRSFSYALSLSRNQNYEVASIKEVEESGVFLNFLDLRDLPMASSQLRYSDLKLHTQTEGNVSWRIRYFDAHDQSAAADSNNFALHNFYTSTVVSSTHWNSLVRTAKSVAFDAEEPLSDLAQERLKANFENVLKSQKVIQVCTRTSRQRVGPCDNQDCRKKKLCHDYLDGYSKLAVPHYRVITMPLALGTPLLVQLFCGVKRGICVPSVQLLTVAQDLDICIAHSSSPVETFAADVKPILKSKFGDIDEYTKYWLPLLRMDAVYNAVKDDSNSTVLQNVTVVFDKTGKRLRGSFAISDKFRTKRAIRISVDDFVCVRVKCFDLDSSKGDVSKMSPHKSSFTWVVHGVITGSSKDGGNWKVSFEACTTLVAEPKIPTAISLKGKNLKAVVELVQLGISHRGIADSLRMVADSLKSRDPKSKLDNQEIVSALCLDHEGAVFKPTGSFQQLVQSVGISIVPGMKYTLNEGQITEIRRALTSKITMIQGPPGTGKSFVGAHLAYYFHQCNKLDPKKPTKILYCGPSNKSVDVVAEYLLESQLKVLRVYGYKFEEEDFPNPLKPTKTSQETEKRPSKKIKSITLHQIIRNPGKPYAELLQKFDEKFKQSEVSYRDYLEFKETLVAAKLQEFEERDVIVCTCSAASILKNSFTFGKNKHRVDKSFKFAQCIIDECGMCSEPETLAPIIASGAEQVVLIGDHMQLQPIIQCKRAKEFGLDVSMFQRKHEDAEMLKNQYRMDPGICEFPSRRFYNGELETDPTVLAREKERKFRFCHPPESGNTSMFCHVVGAEKVNFSLDRGGEFSFYNEIEAQVVIRILFYLYRNNVPLSNIMILSPYSAQVTTIRNLILKERSQLKDVHVGTVVTSQGSESDFVILSTVRSRPSSAIEDQANVQWRRKFIGFVSDPHQINVAITRAKSGLCIVGDQNLLEKDAETWKPLLDAHRKRKSLVYFEDRDAPWNL